ncbi:hypothetical protein [Desulfotruncus alcoholivorax]|nr:hypothetical protein [Desulfotruncus alcoholivorax]
MRRFIMLAYPAYAVGYNLVIKKYPRVLNWHGVLKLNRFCYLKVLT